MKPRRRKNKHQPSRSTAMTAIALGLGVVGFASYAWQSLQKPTADALGCYASLPQSQTTVFVDASNPRWNEEQQRSLKRALITQFNQLGFNERLTVYTTEGDRIGSVVTPSFSVCGTGQDPQALAEAGLGEVSTGYLHKQRERQFQRVFAPELNALLSLTPEAKRLQTQQSPILEMLQAISQQSDMKATYKLVVISDLIQFSDTAKFCQIQGHMPRFQHFKNTVAYQRLKPAAFSDLSVEILWLQRHGFGRAKLRHCYSEDEVFRFWKDYFQHQQVADYQLTRIRTGH